LCAEVEPGVVSYYYCFYNANNNQLVQLEDIAKKYEMNRNKRTLLELALTRVIEKLNNEYANNNQERWSAMTFVLQNNGEFSIDYGYEDLFATRIMERKKWEKKYLNI